MKTCPSCKLSKLYNEFHKNKTTKDGYGSICKICRNLKFKEYYSLNKEFINQKHKNYYNENIEVIAKLHSNYRMNNKTKIQLHDHERDRRVKRRFTRSQRSAKQRKLCWEISLEQFQELCSLDCIYCSNKLENRKFSTSSALDRKDNSKGYIIENVLPCCSMCNYLRGDIMTVEETKQVVNLLITLRGL